MRTLLRRIHLVLGISLGSILAISGATGALMAFGPEIQRMADGTDCNLDQTTPPLSATEQLQAAFAATPDSVFRSATLFGNPACHTELRETTESFDETPRLVLINPSTGQVTHQSGGAYALQNAFHALKEIHQGHWFGPPNPLAQIIWSLFGYGALALMLMVPIGIYLRWPKTGKSSVKTWLAIPARLRGHVLLRRIHLVMGAVVAIPLLVSAHTGAFQAVPIGFYSDAISALVGGVKEEHRWGPPPGGKPQFGDANTVARLLSALDTQPWVRAEVQFERPEVVRFWLNDDSLPGEIQFQPSSADIETRGPQPLPKRDMYQTMDAINQDLHEGKIFGFPGRVLMFLAACSLPFFFISGLLMYFRRRRVSVG